MPPAPPLTRSQARLSNRERDTEDDTDFHSAVENDENEDLQSSITMEEEVTIMATEASRNDFMMQTLVTMQKQQQELMIGMQREHKNHMEMVMKSMEETEIRRDRKRHEGNVDTRLKAKKVDCPRLGAVQDTDMADFNTWKESFEGYANISKLETECNLQGRRTMLRAAIDNTWSRLWTAGMLGVLPDDDIDDIVNKIQGYIRSKRSPFLDRKVFYSRNQKPGESIDEYFADIQIIHDACNWKEESLICEDCDGQLLRTRNMLREQRLLDRMIFGVCDEDIREKVFERPFETMTLSKAYRIMQAAEVARNTTNNLKSAHTLVAVNDMEEDNDESSDMDCVNRLQKSNYKKGKGQPRISKPCNKCGTKHDLYACPAYNTTCNKCGIKGHWEKFCFSGTRREDDTKQLNTINAEIAKVVKAGNKSAMRQLSTTMGRKTKRVDWLCDTGADVCVMNIDDCQAFGRLNIRKCNAKLFSANHKRMGLRGVVKAKIDNKGHTFQTDIYVIQGVQRPILSLTGLRALGILPESWPEDVNIATLSLGKNRKQKCLHIRREIDNNDSINDDELEGETEIEDYAKEFGVNSIQKEPLLQDDIPSRPGETIAADLFNCDGKEYLVITDKFSGWPEVWDFIRGVSSTDVQKAFMKWFMTMGVPNRLTSDHGPQFVSSDFAQFCQEWGIKHDLASPYHHHANAHGEATVNSIKSIVKKTCPGKTTSCKEFWEALLEYRNAPRKDGLSPAQRLFNRPMRTKLSAHPQTFNPISHKQIREADRQALMLRQKAKQRYDRGVRSLSKLEVRDVVRVQHHVTKKWNLIAEVVHIKPRGRSCLIRSETGRLYWRNRRYLRLYEMDGLDTLDCSGHEEANEQEDNCKRTLRRSQRSRRQTDFYKA